MKLSHFLNSVRRALILNMTFCALGVMNVAQAQNSSTPIAEKVGEKATEVTKSIEDTGKTAVNEMEDVWKRIDEKRLKNRTPDELMAWVLMGLLVGGLLYRLTDQGQIKTILIGLTGAFIGGIAANVLKLNWGLGPVLIRYEDLICSLLGGLVLFFALKWYRSRKLAAARSK